MFLTELLFALAMALVFTSIFALGFRRTGPWSSVLIFFLVKNGIFETTPSNDFLKLNENNFFHLTK